MTSRIGQRVIVGVLVAVALTVIFALLRSAGIDL